MRIALVVERFAPSGGGVEQAAWQVAAALHRAGESVSVLCREQVAASPALARQHAAVTVPDDVEVTILPASEEWQPWRVTAFSRRAARAIDARPLDFDVVHAFTRTARQDVYRAGGGRHADSMQHAYGSAGAALRRLTPRHAVQLRADHRIFADARQWIQCPSHTVEREIVDGANVDPARVVVIPNGVDAERHRPGRDAAAQAIRRRHASDRESVWLFAGSGARRKGLDTALRALAATRARDTVLWVAGRDAPAAWRRRAERLGVGGRVRFLGSRDDMPAVYRAADGLLLPTRYDPFANVCLEAAASGLPVVSTRNNGAMEVIADGGVAVDDPGDVGAFAAALDGLAASDRRAAMSARARKRAIAADWTSHAERLRELYDEVVRRRLHAHRNAARA